MRSIWLQGTCEDCTRTYSGPEAKPFLCPKCADARKNPKPKKRSFKERLLGFLSGAPPMEPFGKPMSSMSEEEIIEAIYGHKPLPAKTLTPKELMARADYIHEFGASEPAPTKEEIDKTLLQNMLTPSVMEWLKDPTTLPPMEAMTELADQLVRTTEFMEAKKRDAEAKKETELEDELEKML